MKYIILIYLFLFLTCTTFAQLSEEEHLFRIDSFKTELQKEDISDIDKANCYSKIGSNYYQIKEFPKAIEYKKKALEVLEGTDSKQYISGLLEHLGVFYARINDFDNSLKAFLEALEVAEDSDDMYRYNSLLLNIGITYFEVRDYKRALKFLFKTLPYYEENGEEMIEYLVGNYLNLGAAYIENGQLDSALIYLDKGLHLALDKERFNDLGFILSNKGEIYTKKEDYSKAIIYYSESLDAFKKVDNERGIRIATLGIAHLKMKSDPIGALPLYDTLIKEFALEGELLDLSNCYVELSGLYSDMGDHKKSLDYFMLHQEVEDSIRSKETLLEIARMETHYEIQEMERENKAKLELLEKQKEIDQYRYYLMGGIIVLIILVFLIFVMRFRARQKLINIKLSEKVKEKDILEDELGYKTRELHNFALHLVQKNEFLYKIKDGLKGLKDQSDKSMHPKINDLSLLITQNIKINKELEKFQKSIVELNDDFFKVLTQKFPQLTQKEKQLCAMLRMNFSSKEVAYLNDISEGAVTMARYRLRKKMNLTTDENLGEYLKNLV